VLDERSQAAKVVAPCRHAPGSIKGRRVDVKRERGADSGTDVSTPSAIEARNVALMTCLEEHGAREKP
jgi:hypothetical protein